jgi:hypothetical protein
VEACTATRIKTFVVLVNLTSPDLLIINILKGLGMGKTIHRALECRV